MSKLSFQDSLLLLALLTVFCVALLSINGCGVREELPDFGSARTQASYFPKNIPAGYGPRANECAERNGDKQVLDGICAVIVGQELHLTWSEPCENTSNLPATCKVRIAFHCAYGAAGKQNYFEDGDSVLVMPHKMRLAKGTIKIPLDCIEAKNLAGVAPERWFDQKQGPQRNWTGIQVSGPDTELEFIWAGEDPDGTVKLRWISRLVSVTHKATVKADNAAPATLDTAACPIEVCCVLINKDGKEVARDSTKLDGSAGQKEAAGWFRIKMADALEMDWDRCKADWVRILPETKKISRGPARKIYALTTAYCPCARCTFGTGQTATGKSAWIGGAVGVAADWRAIPAGSFVSIKGYNGGKPAEVDDTGAAMRRAYARGIVHVDLRMPYHWQARNWGEKWMELSFHN